MLLLKGNVQTKTGIIRYEIDLGSMEFCISMDGEVWTGTGFHSFVRNLILMASE